jgi:isochorismate hydrolase
MQHYFLDPGSHAFVPSAPELVPGVLRLIDAFALRARPIFFTRHGNTPDDGSAMTRWWGGVLEKGSAHWPLDKGLADHAPASQIIDKTRYDAFCATDLEMRLQNAAVGALHICGVMTHLCCETTARSAFVRGYEVFMVADATATYHYDLHLGALRGLAHGFARIAWTKDYVAT